MSFVKFICNNNKEIELGKIILKTSTMNLIIAILLDFQLFLDEWMENTALKAANLMQFGPLVSEKMLIQ